MKLYCTKQNIRSEAQKCIIKLGVKLSALESRIKQIQTNDLTFLLQEKLSRVSVSITQHWLHCECDRLRIQFHTHTSLSLRAVGQAHCFTMKRLPALIASYMLPWIKRAIGTAPVWPTSSECWKCCDFCYCKVLQLFIRILVTPCSFIYSHRRKSIEIWWDRLS